MLFLIFFANAEQQKGIFYNTLEEVRDLAQKSTDIATNIQETGTLKQVPELLYRIEKIEIKIDRLLEIHKNQH